MVIEVNHVLYGLVAVSVVAHVHDLHLPDFVDDTAIIAFVEYRRQHKHGIHHPVEGILAPIKSMSPADRGKPTTNNASCFFGKGITPLQGIERRLETPSSFLPRISLWAGRKDPGSSARLAKGASSFFDLLERKSQLVDAPIVIGIPSVRAAFPLIPTL